MLPARQHSEAILYPEVALQRQPPHNLQPADADLFAKEYTRLLPATRVAHWQGLRVNAYGAAFAGWQVVDGSLRNDAQLARYNWKTVLRLRLQQRALQVPRLLLFAEEWSQGYFHWLCDALPRLWALQPHWGSHAVWLPRAYDLEYVRTTLQLLGLAPQFFERGTYLLAKDVQLATMVAPPGNYRPEALQALFAALSQAAAIAPATPLPFAEVPTVLFVSRAKAPRRFIAQEELMLEMLAPLGVQLVYMEDLDMLQKLQALRHCTLLIGLHGAGLTNMLFMPPGGAVLELRFAADAHNNAYFSLADAMGHRYYYLKGKGSHPDTHSANLVIDPAVVADTVRTILQG
jgi:capsular polysaccharide biosynthesis protein